ncbi:type III-B CRISPR module RAMP protein Cmr4 [Desulfoscipio gibsoniae]
MKNAVIGLLAETSLHPGTEQSTGVVDLPVARESSTGYPVIVGSSLKGALKDLARQKEILNINEIFGEQNNAGAVAVTDARLLLLPVRSLTGHFKWVTCPYLLERYMRDSKLAGRKVSLDIPVPEKEHAVVTENMDGLFLEELSFEVTQQDITNIAEAIQPLICHSFVRERLASQLVILCDDDFQYYASYGLQVNARNKLDEVTKTSENLWYEETLPPDSLFYALLITRPNKENALQGVKELFNGRPYLQVGGNETVGQGWCAVQWLGEGEV